MRSALQDAKECEIRFGFVASVRMTGARWASKGARLFEHDPIEELIVESPNAPGLAAIAGVAHTARLRSLRVDYFEMSTRRDVDALRAFLASKHIGALRELSIQVGSFGTPPDTTGLLDGIKLSRIERLELEFSGGLRRLQPLANKLR